MKKNTNLSERKNVPIFGLTIASARKVELLNHAWRLVEGNDLGSKGRRKSALIVTPNPEIAIQALQDPELAEIMNQADLSLPDGIGIIAAQRFLGLPRIRIKILAPFVYLYQGLEVGLGIIFDQQWLFVHSDIAPGRWMFAELAKRAGQKGKKVFLLGGAKGVAEKTANNLVTSYQLPVTSLKWNSGPRVSEDGRPKTEKDQRLEKETIKQINKFKPDLLFVAFGAPKQEKWLARNLPKLKVGVAMTVGGAFDYVAGKVSRPPILLASAGFEWFWRLITQPWRFKRVIRALIEFPLQVYLYKLKNEY